MDTRNLTKLVKFSDDAPNRETLFETERLRSEVISLQQKQETEPMTDPVADVLLTVVAGEVVIYIDRKFKRFKQWGAVVAPAGSEVVIKNASGDPAVMLLVGAPPPTRD